MVHSPTSPVDTELSSYAAEAMIRLSQRSADEKASLKSLWAVITYTLEHEDLFFLRVPTSPYEPRKQDRRTAILQDTGALLALPEVFARDVVCKVEGRLHNLSHEDMSSERRQEFETLTARLAVQHPDHVTNVFRLWKMALDMKERRSAGDCDVWNAADDERTDTTEVED